MDLRWNTTHIDLQNLIHHARGDKSRMMKYLIQFQELVPVRIDELKENMSRQSRNEIRQTIHQMSPQLQFFGIPNIDKPLSKIEVEYKTMSFHHIQMHVNDILLKLEKASSEVDNILENHF